jgi:metal-responsive CopG/Arc/MetJ family transcriptional regulator
MERIIVTLPSETLHELDAVAEKLERKRSRVIREALGEWLALQRQREFEALLEEGYRSQADTLAQLTEEFAALQAEATKATWRWDD